MRQSGKAVVWRDVSDHVDEAVIDLTKRQLEAEARRDYPTARFMKWRVKPIQIHGLRIEWHGDLSI